MCFNSPCKGTLYLIPEYLCVLCVMRSMNTWLVNNHAGTSKIKTIISTYSYALHTQVQKNTSQSKINMYWKVKVLLNPAIACTSMLTGALPLAVAYLRILFTDSEVRTTYLNSLSMNCTTKEYCSVAFSWMVPPRNYIYK